MDSEICTHCVKNTLGYYIHAIWYCTPIEHFWQDVTGRLCLLLKHLIPISPSVCLLRDTSEINITQISRKIHLIALSITKKNYPEKQEIREHHQCHSLAVKALAMISSCFSCRFSHTEEFLTQFSPQQIGRELPAYSTNNACRQYHPLCSSTILHACCQCL